MVSFPSLHSFMCVLFSITAQVKKVSVHEFVNEYQKVIYLILRVTRDKYWDEYYNGSVI